MRKDRSMAADGLLKSGLKLIGAKTGQTKDSGRRKIYACEPPNVVTYVEPFIGSANVLVGKRPHPVEVVGDIQKYVINYFHTLQRQPGELFPLIAEHVERIEKGQAEYFHQIRKAPPEEGTLEWAAWYYIINKYCFNGIVRFNNSGECNSTYCGQTTGRGVYDADWFSKVCDRLDGVHFNCIDYSALLAYANGKLNLPGVPKADPETTWVVLDPPYSQVYTMYDKEQFLDDDHVWMKEILDGAGYRWLLTINDIPFIRELYKDYQMYEHEIFYSCSQTPAGRGKSKELIICNYEVPKQGFTDWFTVAAAKNT